MSGKLPRISLSVSGWGLVGLLALTGCADEGGTPSDFPHARMTSAQTRHRITLHPLKLPAPKSGSGSDSSVSGPDTIINGPGMQSADTLTSAPSPLATDADGLGDAQPRMPTKHSHWLKGDIMEARVVVTLNQAPLATYLSPMDQDITMRCRAGINTITFAYTPSSKISFANVRVLESEHDPPIGPLAAFNTLPLTVASRNAQKPITRTFTFLAR